METLIQKWYKHGISVHEWYHKLIANPEIIGCEPIVEWFKSYQYLDEIGVYHFHHDCGKPYCIEYDEEGKAHYPNHSEVSYKIFSEKFPDHPDLAEMVRLDMGFHKLKGAELEEHAKHPFADHLYATAWAEIYANAELFGGLESESFKIKKKKLVKSLKLLNRRQICQT